MGLPIGPSILTFRHMFSIERTFITLPDKMVEVIRKYPESKVKNIEGIHEWLDTDILLKKNGWLFFCIKIDEAEIVEE